MKNLFLLRHAHAASNKDDDINRPLTNEGILKCQNLSSILEPYLHNIDLILSSSAVRTTQTIETILNNSGIRNKQTLYDQKLYNVSEESLLEYLSNIELQFPTSPNNILLVNHNPAISHLAGFLAQESTVSPYYLDLLKGLAPGSLVLFQADIDSWQQLSPENVSLKNFWR